MDVNTGRRQWCISVGERQATLQMALVVLEHAALLASPHCLVLSWVRSDWNGRSRTERTFFLFLVQFPYFHRQALLGKELLPYNTILTKHLLYAVSPFKLIVYCSLFLRK